MDAPLPPTLVPAWQRWFNRPDYKDVAVLSSECNVCEELFKDGLLFPLQRRRELGQMLTLAAAQQPTTIMEIGADKGGGLYHWCLLPTVKHIIACELRGTPYSQLFEAAFPHISFLWLNQSSYMADTAATVQLRLTEQQASIDVLFIDGDKNSFMLDWLTYKPMLKSGGLVLMHDIRDSPPKVAFAQLAQDYPTRTIIDASESLAAMTRARHGFPVTTAYEGWLRHWAGRSCGVGVIYNDH